MDEHFRVVNLFFLISSFDRLPKGTLLPRQLPSFHCSILGKFKRPSPSSIFVQEPYSFSRFLLRAQRNVAPPYVVSEAIQFLRSRRSTQRAESTTKHNNTSKKRTNDACELAARAYHRGAISGIAVMDINHSEAYVLVIQVPRH